MSHSILESPVLLFPRNNVIEIRCLLDELYKDTKRVNPRQMRKYMGFPPNWESIKDCPLHE